MRERERERERKKESKLYVGRRICQKDSKSDV